MKKFYTFLILFYSMLNGLSKVQGQVNYVFSKGQSTFSPLTSGIIPSLSNPLPIGYQAEDEGFANNISIGFAFTFNNNTYTQLNLNVNGFITFGAEFSSIVNDKNNVNSLTHGLKQSPGVYGIIAPLWDDLRLRNVQSLQYKTTGTAPNRVFTAEWNNVAWDFNAMKESITFQVKLYETSNAIDFIYQPIGAPNSNASASIGIATCSDCTGSFLSVGGFDTEVSVSGVKEFDNISSIPSNGQVYHFQPGSCNTIQSLNMGDYNSRSASFSWMGSSSNGFDYAVTTSPLQPLSATNISTTNITVNGLQPGTQYYMHVRSACNSTAKSGWATYSFKTACEISLPYKETFENFSNNQIPECIKVANPTGGVSWKLQALSIAPPYNNVITYKSDNNQTADAWFVLPAANLEGGKSYKIKFRYKIGDTAGINQKIEVKIGTMLNSNFSGWSTIYRNTKISEPNFKDTSLLFATPINNIYFIAFRCYSDKNTSSLSIDDIELTVVKPSSVKMVSFSGNRVGDKNLLAWRTSSELKNKSFELQKSIDGQNFKSIETINSKAPNGNSILPIDYNATDNTPFAGFTYYRLKIIDLDLNEFYSQTINVKAPLPAQIVLSKVFPNPASDFTTVIVTSPYNTSGNFLLTDAYGKVALNMPVTLYKGDNQIKVYLGNLGKGIYMSKLYCGPNGEAESKTFIKQ